MTKVSLRAKLITLAAALVLAGVTLLFFSVNAQADETQDNRIAVPILQQSDLTYTGSEQTVFTVPDGAHYSIVWGDKATNVGEYSMRLWADWGWTFDVGFWGSQYVDISWRIVSAAVAVPESVSYDWCGKWINAPYTSCTEYTVLATSELWGKEIRQDGYVVYLKANENYYFADGSCSGGKYCEVRWYINKVQVALPSSSNLTYNGVEQQANVSAPGLNSLYKIYDGEGSHHAYKSTFAATNAGTYSIWYQLYDSAHYTWADSVECAYGQGLYCLNWTIDRLTLSGDQTISIAQNSGAKITCSGIYSDLTSLKFDGKTLDLKNLPKGMTVEAGSTIVKTTADFNKKLSLGTHTLELAYDNTAGNYAGEGDQIVFTSTITVTEGVANTGDSATPFAVALLLAAAAAGVLIVRTRRQRN